MCTLIYINEVICDLKDDPPVVANDLGVDLQQPLAVSSGTLRLRER
jgi:hypothetical protein